MPRRILKSEKIFDGKVVHLRVDTVQLENGQTVKREVIDHKGAVAVVAIDKDDRVILVKQYRDGAEKELLELPAGGLEVGEEREFSARRELQEEIGYYPETLIKLGDFYVAASYTTELISIYLAEGLRPSELPQDSDEQIEVVRIPFDEVIQQALSNEITDSKTLIGIIWAAKHLGRLSN